MCGFLVEELRELQRVVTRSMVEQERNGMAGDLPQQSAGQVPKVFSPHSLEGVSSGQHPDTVEGQSEESIFAESELRRKELAEGLRGVFAATSREAAVRLASELADRWRESHPRVAEHIEEHIEEYLCWQSAMGLLRV